jgi:hypothetical protein
MLDDEIWKEKKSLKKEKKNQVSPNEPCKFGLYSWIHNPLNSSPRLNPRA